MEGIGKTALLHMVKLDSNTPNRVAWDIKMDVPVYVDSQLLVFHPTFTIERKMMGEEKCMYYLSMHTATNTPK